MASMLFRTNKLYISNLPWTINSMELRKYFAQFGPVTLARVIFDKDSGFSKGYGYVTFSTTDSLERVMKISSHVVEGHYLVIQPCE